MEKSDSQPGNGKDETRSADSPPQAANETRPPGDTSAKVLDENAIGCYLDNIAEQADYALITYTDACFALAEKEKFLASPPSVFGSLNEGSLGRSEAIDARIWLSLQSFVVFAANVSKLLWHEKGFGKRRAEKLRVLLEVEDNSPLRSNGHRNDVAIYRKLRNALEHYDERLDELISKGGPLQMIGRSISWGERPEALGFDPANVMRDFDPITVSYIFQGESYDLKVLAEELTTIAMKCSAIKAKRRCWPQ